MTDITDERLAEIAQDVAPYKWLPSDATGSMVVNGDPTSTGHCCNLPALRAALEQQRKEGAKEALAQVVTTCVAIYRTPDCSTEYPCSHCRALQILEALPLEQS